MDLIDRQAVIDKINEIYCYLSLSYKQKEYETARALFLDIKNAIKTMPSAEPEIIRCMDCVNAEERGCALFCGFWTRYTSHKGYCFKAERRTDE